MATPSVRKLTSPLETRQAAAVRSGAPRYFLALFKKNKKNPNASSGEAGVAAVFDPF